MHDQTPSAPKLTSPLLSVTVPRTLRRTEKVATLGAVTDPRELGLSLILPSERSPATTNSITVIEKRQSSPKVPLSESDCAHNVQWNPRASFVAAGGRPRGSGCVTKRAFLLRADAVLAWSRAHRGSCAVYDKKTLLYVGEPRSALFLQTQSNAQFRRPFRQAAWTRRSTRTCCRAASTRSAKSPWCKFRATTRPVRQLLKPTNATEIHCCAL